MDGEQSNKQLLRMDIPNNLSLSVIIIFPLLMMFILIPLSFYCSVCEILMYFIWYLSFLAIILQDRTTIEIGQNTVKINRLLFGPLFINRNDIIKAEVRKNIHHTYRILWYLLMVVTLVHLANNAYYRIQGDILNNYPAEALFYSFLSSSILIIFFCSIFFNLERRLRFSSILEVTTGNGKYKFYTHSPEELENIIDGNVQVMGK